MKPFPEQTLSAEIETALKAVSDARDSLVEVLTGVQRTCEHRIVSEMPYRSSEYLGSTPAHRICNHCRFIEEGSHWSGGTTWSKHDHTHSDLGNTAGRIVIPIDRDTFYKMRITS